MTFSVHRILPLALIALLHTTSGVAQTAAVDPNRFEAEIRRFDEADKGTPFEPGVTL